MHAVIKPLALAIAMLAGGAAFAGATFYESENFGGREIRGDGSMPNFRAIGFNDRASSLRVDWGYWIFCRDARFQGECRTFGPGEYRNLPPALNNRISSGRRVSNDYPYPDQPAWR